MKISVIMIDGNFRENTFGSDYFLKQDFNESEYEVIWVEFYQKANPNVEKHKRIKIITLNNAEDEIYHSSYCFNRGITEAEGDVLVIPDADQIVEPDFLSRVWQTHTQYDQLVMYGYRHDEVERGMLNSLEFKELKRKCKLKNPLNYGGCLTIRKKWLLEVNGYEQHPVFRSGFHANGLDLFTRFKNRGLAIRWNPELILYHPWHPFTLKAAPELEVQKLFIEWRKRHLHWKAIQGIDASKNCRNYNDIFLPLNQIVDNHDKANRDRIRRLLIGIIDLALKKLGGLKRLFLKRF